MSKQYTLPKVLPSSWTRTSRKPNPYPLLYHLLHFAQLLCALVVSAVLSFFVEHLRNEHYAVPWTFSLLLTTSILTLIHLIFSVYVDLTRTVNPATHLIQNAVLTVCWIVSLGLLLNNLSWTLGHQCVVTRWHNQAGIMICRMYKALAAFAVCGTAATCSALALDVVVRQRLRKRGVYNTVGVQMKTPVIRVGEGSSDPREVQGFGDGWDRTDYDGDRPMPVHRPVGTKQFEYGVPPEQTQYDGHKLT